MTFSQSFFIKYPKLCNPQNCLHLKSKEVSEETKYIVIDQIFPKTFFLQCTNNIKIEEKIIVIIKYYFSYFSHILIEIFLL